MRVTGEHAMWRAMVVVALALVVGGAGPALAAAPLEDGFSCECRNRAEAIAKQGSSGAPSGGAERGEESAAGQGKAQFNFCFAYP